MKKVLLYTGKKTAIGNDVDGGSIAVEHTIEALKNYCYLDVVIKNSDNVNYFDDSVNNLEICKVPLLSKNKFICRLEESIINKRILQDYYKYDIIIVQHVSSLFGTEEFSNDFWSKVILFPMFLSPSYIKSNEDVPLKYIEAEQKVMNLVENIITPSIIEKEEILKQYSNIKNIVVIPRGITKFINFLPKKNIINKVSLINIGSIKKQKNQLDSLKVLKGLLEKGIDAHLTFITTNQDALYRDTLTKFILDNNLSKNIEFCFSLSQKEVAKKIEEADFNISTSNWETFGRGIYEGVCGGKFTFVFDNLIEVKRFVNDNKAIIFCENFLDMVNKIEFVVKNYQTLFELSKNDFDNLISKVSYDKEANELRRTILNL